MAWLSRLDQRTVLVAAAVQVAVAVPPVVVARALTAGDPPGGSWLPVAAVAAALVVAPSVAGVFAASRRPDAPLAHAAAGALVGWLLLAAVTMVRVSLARGVTGAQLVTIVSFAPIDVGVAVLAAFAATYRRERTEP